MPNHSIYIRRRIFLSVILLLIIFLLFYSVKIGIRKFINPLKQNNITIIEGQLKPGQVLFTSMLENGITNEAANSIITSLQGMLDLTSLKVSDQCRLYIDENKKVVKFIYEKTPIEKYFSVLDESGKFNAFKPEIFIKKQTLTKEFTIKSSLFQAMLDGGEQDALVFDLVDIFAWDIDFNSYPRVGDKIKIYFEKYYLQDKNGKAGEFAKYGKIIAAQYAGRDSFDAVYYKPHKDSAGYFNLSGKPVEKFFLKSPLKFTGRITSLFGGRRDPFTSRHSHHSGVDFASYYGAPIVATAGGTVTFTGWKGAYGKLVILRHSNGYITYYGHCSNFRVSRGQGVNQGQVIASVGSTGRSTGPHCHYEIRLNNQAFNPLKFNQVKKKPLSGEDLAQFQQHSKEVWQNISSL